MLQKETSFVPHNVFWLTCGLHFFCGAHHMGAWHHQCATEGSNPPKDLPGGGAAPPAGPGMVWPDWLVDACSRWKYGKQMEGLLWSDKRQCATQTHCPAPNKQTPHCHFIIRQVFVRAASFLPSWRGLCFRGSLMPAISDTCHRGAPIWTAPVSSPLYIPTPHRPTQFDFGTAFSLPIFLMLLATITTQPGPSVWAAGM